MFTFEQIYQRELIQACANGIQFFCTGGLFIGDVIIRVSNNYKAIDIVIQAENPDLEAVRQIFQFLIEQEFPKYIIPKNREE